MNRRKALAFISGSAVVGSLYGLHSVVSEVWSNRTGSKSPLLAEYHQEINIDDGHIKDSIDKSKNFDQNYSDDVLLEQAKYYLLQQTVNRLAKVQSLVGHANFSLLSFDAMLRYAKNYTSVGTFTHAEKEFLEEIFFANANEYGFLGEKVVMDLTAGIKEADTVKIPHTGNYLFKSESLRMYNKLKQDVGESLILTSGIRSVVKQMYLFLAKAIESEGNLSQASRSLAPPGHSYHGIGDFDVGKTNFGEANFTAKFAETNEFKKLVDLGYAEIRYTPGNQIGVRYEPWHIKVV